MKTFYSCFIESVLTFSFIWHESLSVKQEKRWHNIVKVCSKISGTALGELNDLYEARSVKTTVFWRILASHSSDVKQI